MKKPYLIDDNPADFMDIIRLARSLGWDGVDGIFLSSQASEFLRERGHFIGDNPIYLGGPND